MPHGARALPFTSRGDIAATLPTAVAHLRAGGVLAYPTETVYGLGSLVSGDGPAQVRALKARPDGKPFLLLIDGLDMLRAIGAAWPRTAAALADRFWPGPLTMLLHTQGAVDASLHGPRGEIAVRWTSHAGALSLVHAVAAPLISTSANSAGLPPARSAQEIVIQWPRAVERGQLVVLDGGRSPSDTPSTIVDCAGAVPRLVRAGAITVASLREVVPDLAGEG